jgi:ATP-dependent DNA helicase RecG
VDDKTHTPVGINSPLDEEERLCSIIADSISPRLVPDIEMITVKGKTLLVIEVFLSGSRPHWLKEEGPENGVYVRLGSTNRQADRELIAELRRTAEGIGFDELPMPELSVGDLDTAAMKPLFRDQREPSENDLLTLRLVTREQRRLVPTKGGVLLFGKERTQHFPDAWVQCGRFVGRNKASIFDHIELYDHLPQAVDSIMLFLKKHAMRGADFSEIRRKDVWSIPLGILREVVINALVHADYSQRGAPIRIAFFDDRIEIENPGILLPGMTIDDMRRGVSRIRNHVIARVFRELKLIEQWGSGVPLIFQEALAQGLPMPEIIEIGMRIRFIVPLAEPIVLKRTTEQVKGQVTEHVEAQVGPESGLESGLESGPESLAKRIILCLSKSALSKSELAQALGHSSISSKLNIRVNELIDSGFIERTMPDKPNSRLQKYRLTKKGKQLVPGMHSRGDE